MSNIIRELDPAQVEVGMKKEAREIELDQRLVTLANLGDIATEPTSAPEQLDAQSNPAHMAAAKKVTPLGVLRTARDAVIKSTSTPPAHRIR
jgi:hypothetical protein